MGSRFVGLIGLRRAIDEAVAAKGPPFVSAAVPQEFPPLPDDGAA
jgi:hypothetical protein